MGTKPDQPRDARLTLDRNRQTHPPTPTLHKASNTQTAAKFGDPAAMRPKTAAIPRVQLKAHFRPIMSHPKPRERERKQMSNVDMGSTRAPNVNAPQKKAPKHNPMFWAKVKNVGVDALNSLATGASNWSQSTKSCHSPSRKLPGRTAAIGIFPYRSR